MKYNFDAALHILLLGGYAFVVYALLYLPLPLSVASIASFIIFIREVSQKQESIDDVFCKICTGWNFWNWSDNKKFETWVPIAVGLAIGGILSL